MKKFFRKTLFFSLLSFSTLSIGYPKSSLKTLQFSKSLKTCLTAEINSAEGILHIVIEGTHEYVGTISIKNTEGDIVYTSEIKCWNERTVVDLSLDEFKRGNYDVSFKSIGLNCSTEFAY